MIEINLSKIERGLRTERVRVVRDGKVYYRNQRVGQKKKSSGRLGTGKIASLPQEIRDEILFLRSIGESGAKIKEAIEDGITTDEEGKPVFVTVDKEKKAELAQRDKELNEKYFTTTDPEEKEKIIEQRRAISDQYTKKIPIPDTAAVKDGKLMVGAQALVDWAKVRGVEPSVKRQTKLRSEKEANKWVKDELDKLQSKLSREQVENQELREKLKALNWSREEQRKAENDIASKKLIADQQKKIKELYDEIQNRDQKIKAVEKENMKLRGKIRDIEAAIERLMKEK